MDVIGYEENQSGKNFERPLYRLFSRSSLSVI